eukprot:11173076-Ditylum_brightwellii.AAC.1
MTKSDWMSTFVESIVDPDFETVQQLLEHFLLKINQGDRTFNTKEFTNMADSRQQKLNKASEDDMEVCSQRAHFAGQASLGITDPEKHAILQLHNSLFGSLT